MCFKIVALLNYGEAYPELMMLYKDLKISSEFQRNK